MHRSLHKFLTITAILIALALGTYSFRGHSASLQPFSLESARQNGTFEIGTSRSSVTKAFDAKPGTQLLQLQFDVMPGASAGFWARGFPASISSGAAEVAEMHFRLAGGNSARPITATMELKGSNGVQSIPVQLHSGTNTAKQLLDWSVIGQLKEAVVLVSSSGAPQPVSGVLSFDILFRPLSWPQKMSLLPAAQLAALLLLGLLSSGLAAYPAKLQINGTIPGWLGLPRVFDFVEKAKALKRDFVLGTSVAVIAIVACAIYHAGLQNRLESGWIVLAIAASGGLLSEWIKLGLTGKHLTSSEIFRDITATGLLALSASSLPLLQAPNHWQHLFWLNSLVAAAAAVLYHVTNLHRLAGSGRHLSVLAGSMIACTPYLAGVLLLLQPVGLAAQWPAAVKTFLGVLLLWGFNEVVSGILGMAVHRTAGRSVRLHLMLLGCAAAAMTAPWIADLGSGSITASLPGSIRWFAVALAAAISQASLWPEVYLISGMMLDALGKTAPSVKTLDHPIQGLKKGFVFGGVLMGLLCAIDGLSRIAETVRFIAAQPFIPMIIIGAAVFPLAKTLIETFDGSQSFFRRTAYSYSNPVLYFRGAVAGLGVGYGLSHAVVYHTAAARIAFGSVVGLAASSGISLLRDARLSLRQRGNMQSWRVYLVDALMGTSAGAGLAFYFDAAQLSAVLTKFYQYMAVGQSPQTSGIYSLLSRWGYIQLGTASGGVKLLFNESLTGIITWAIPAWLFAINAAFLSAFLRRDRSPVAALFGSRGLMQLGQNTIQVFRWGLWMAPIISSLMRPMSTPTWYNQDGAVRSILALFHYLTSSGEAFNAWSLGVFVSILAYSSVRILVWLDHMGLRVATLVNLSFLGMDRLDGRLARFLGPAATAHCIPEAIKRFATWTPLLIPFYLPRGAEWDYVWSQSEQLRTSAGSGVSSLFALPPAQALLIVGTAMGGCTLISAAIRHSFKKTHTSANSPEWKLANSQYEIVLKQNGEMYSRSLTNGCDLSRRSYDSLHPAGRALFLVDRDCDPETPDRYWALLGNFHREQSVISRIERRQDCIELQSSQNGIRTTIEFATAGNDPAERWKIRIENLSGIYRSLKLIPYIEWVLAPPGSDRGHTQLNRLYPEMEYAKDLQAIFAWHKQTRALGILATNALPEGFVTSRMDFIGRAQSIANPRILQTLAFTAANATDPHPTFDPAGSLMIGVGLKPGESTQILILAGLTKDKKEAVELITQHIPIQRVARPESSRPCRNGHTIGHGEILPGTPQPYYHLLENGRRLRIHTPFTPRPYDHSMSNAAGHVMAVTNRGLHTSSNGNSQQNRLTPDWPDTVTCEVPGEAIYLHDIDSGHWYSPTYHPLNDRNANYEAEFSMDGTAVYRMRQGSLETDLTTFVPIDDPAGVYLLTIRNPEDSPKRIRIAPYFQIVLADQPENSGPLKVRFRDEVLFFENPRNEFRTGPAFVAMTESAECVETKRGRFFGSAKQIANPYMVREGMPDDTERTDRGSIASMLATLEVPPRGSRTVAIVLGQAGSYNEAASIARKYRDVQFALSSLAATRDWWRNTIARVEVVSDHPDVDGYLDWLKYQTITERIWARRGFYQASGAYGFRDQLQDCVNLTWVDPQMARTQIMLHAAQQFVEGDSVHWFHRLHDGRTGFAARTYASDNLLWLAWAVVEYIGFTADYSLLDERVPYLEAELPPRPLPTGKQGMGFIPLRSSQCDSIYGHCIRAIDLVLKHRMGLHALPLIGTGDWNDGLDEIGSEGRGESVWLGFFLHYILQRMIPIIEKRDFSSRCYTEELRRLERAIQATWRGDRYLRAIHDDGTEIGAPGNGVWEIDALTAAWAVISGIDPQRGRTVFDTAISILEAQNTISLGWPPLREDTDPYLGRSSWYPRGVRENGMYCHGVQWLVGAAHSLSVQCRREQDTESARRYAETAYRLWLKISPLSHVSACEIEIYGGQPNKQAADMLTEFEPGRMGWHGYTGAAGWMFRQALEGLLGLRLEKNRVITPREDERIGPINLLGVKRIQEPSTIRGPGAARCIEDFYEAADPPDPDKDLRCLFPL